MLWWTESIGTALAKEPRQLAKVTTLLLDPTNSLVARPAIHHHSRRGTTVARERCTFFGQVASHTVALFSPWWATPDL